ncbi:MAG: HEAT repeat domain-containing protein [Phycisphaerae bacterium]|jgi:HEAT repeat protein
MPPRKTRSNAAGLALLLSGLLLAGFGCQSAAPRLTPDESLALERRATDLLLRAAQSEDPLVACHAIEALVHVAPEEGRPHFRAALRSPSPLLRAAGLKALGTLADGSSAAMYRQLLSDNHPLVRLAAAFAVCRAGQTSAARLLVTALDDNPEEHVRAEAAQLIGRLEEPRAIKRLQAALRLQANEQSNIVRLEIYTALARLGDEEGTDRLIAAAQHDALSRLLALQGLADVGTQRARDVLRYHLSDAEDYLIHRLIAARGLARLGEPIGYDLAIEKLRFVGSNPEDPEEAVRVRTNAAMVLGEIRDARALPDLQNMAESENDPRLQVAACYAICRILQP